MPSKRRTIAALAATTLLITSCCLHLPREIQQDLALETRLQLDEVADEVDALIDEALRLRAERDRSVTPEQIAAERERLRAISTKIREAGDAVEFLWLLAQFDHEEIAQ